MKAYQRTLEGGIKVATGHWAQDQVREVLENNPEARDDDALMIALWWRDQQSIRDLPLDRMVRQAEVLLRIDPRRRRQELRDEYPYGAKEEERRQKRAKGGVPG